MLLTPHMAGVTRDALQRGACHVARDVARVRAGEPPVTPVLP